MSYNELKKIAVERKLPCIGTNEYDEIVIIVSGRDSYGEYYQTIVAQENGWLRVNTYYSDGTTTESYNK